MDPCKVQAIADWVQPTSLKALQRFLGFANYYRKFIKNFSVVAKPLTDLTKAGADLLNWRPEAVQAFKTLKLRFTESPVLSQPDFSKPFIVEVDASDAGVGAVLSQGSPALTNLRPCSYFSRKFSSSERNYDVGNRELLAIKWAFEEWRHFLEGAKHRITVLTDHKNLEFLESAKRLNPRQARWALFFTRFNFSVTYRPGSKNVKADALSRSFCPEQAGDLLPEPILQDGIVVSTLSPDLFSLIKGSQHLAPSTTPPGRWFVPVHLRLALLKEIHEAALGGHPGVGTTKELISRTLWWASLATDVKEYVSACEVCARSKPLHTRPAGQLCPLPLPLRPWTHISMDFITELPDSEGRTVIWVIVDRFSKMCHLVPLKRLPNAKTLAKLFVKHLVRLHGLPENVVSDRGAQFVSRFWRAFCARLGVQLSFSSAFHPESNGQTERVNQTLEQYLRCFIGDNQEEWSSYLPLAELAINNHSHSSLGTSPFFCNFGFHPRFGSFSPLASDMPEVDDLARDLNTVWSKALVNLKRTQVSYKRSADMRRCPGPTFVVGDLVWLSTKNLKIKGSVRKFAPRFIGPFPIVKIINEVSFQLELPPSFKIHHTFHKSLLKRFVPPVNPASSPPPPVQVEDQLEFEILRIVDSRRVRNSLQYLVHWKGYGPEERSWVPASDVHAEALVRNFHRRFPGKPGPRFEGPEALHKRGGSIRTYPPGVQRRRAHSRSRLAAVVGGADDAHAREYSVPGFPSCDAGAPRHFTAAPPLDNTVASGVPCSLPRPPDDAGRGRSYVSLLLTDRPWGQPPSTTSPIRG